MAQISPKLVAALVRYEPETGELFWRPRKPDLFSPNGTGGAVGASNRWNALFAGKRCFCTDSQRGYLRGVLLDRPMYAHRVAWAVFHLDWPIFEIDHINGNRADNRISNLRDVPHISNSRNQKLHSHNTSGVCGVSWKSGRGHWEACIGSKFIGCFQDFDDAVAARKAAEIDHNFHINHGRSTQ